MDEQQPILATPEWGEPPSLEALMARGQLASNALYVIIEDMRQQRQTLLYCVASLKRGVKAMNKGRRPPGEST